MGAVRTSAEIEVGFACGGDVFGDLMNAGLRILLSLDVLGHDGRMQDAAQLRMAGAVVPMTDTTSSRATRDHRLADFSCVTPDQSSLYRGMTERECGGVGDAAEQHVRGVHRGAVGGMGRCPSGLEERAFNPCCCRR